MSVLHLVILGLCAVGSAATDAAGIAHLEQNANAPGVTVLPSGLQYRVITASPTPDGRMPAVNSPCVCHYHGSLIDGTVFDSSVKRGSPLTFAPNQVIKGWTEALQLMHEGDKWELTIPSDLAYGDRGSPPKIPGGSVLVFELELITVKEASAFSVGGIDFANPQLLFSAAMLALFLYKNFATGGGAKGPKVSLEEAMKSPANPTVFFDMKIGDEDAGRIEMVLFKEHFPKTAENFRMLCTGEMGIGRSGKKLHYAGSSFHRVFPNIMCLGGDITAGNGTGGESIYGAMFDDEFDKGVVGHTEPLLLSMANTGPNTNGSQFFLTTKPTPHLDGKHVVFGKVVTGGDVVKRIEGVGSGSGRTSKAVTIAGCGEVTKKTE
mmetsp:Transcript_32887/g.77929  ORF Transcript_32887/g.77929 Transcript_32887/m.77929 type:complete len:378 (-) Transcript_32887:144-1277(-)